MGCKRWSAAVFIKNSILAAKALCNLIEMRFYFIDFPAVSESSVFGVSLLDRNEGVTL